MEGPVPLPAGEAGACNGGASLAAGLEWKRSTRILSANVHSSQVKWASTRLGLALPGRHLKAISSCSEEDSVLV